VAAPPASRFGLSGARLAAAVISAVGLGFGGGLLVAGRGSPDTVTTPPEAAPSEAPREGTSAPTPTPENVAAPEAVASVTTGPAVASDAQAERDRVHASTRGLDVRSPGKRRRGASLREERPAGRGVTPDGPAFENHADRLLPRAPTDGAAIQDGNLDVETGIDAAMADMVATPTTLPATDAPAGHPDKVRSGDTLVRAEVPDENPVAGRTRIRVMLGGAATPLRLEPPEAPRDEDDATTANGTRGQDLHGGALVTLGAVRLPEGAHGTVLGAEVGVGRMLAMRRPSTVVQAGADVGHAWNLGRARLDLGGHLGVQGFLRAGGDSGRGGTPNDVPTDDRFDASDDPPLAERAALLTVGPVAAASFGGDEGARGTVRLAPLLHLAPGRAPTPWVQLTLGLELPARRGS
jgi:hypothetical protein